MSLAEFRKDLDMVVGEGVAAAAGPFAASPPTWPTTSASP